MMTWHWEPGKHSKKVDEDKILGSVLCDTKLHAKALMQFIDVLAFHNGSVEKLNLENERYYMIPLTKVEK